MTTLTVGDIKNMLVDRIDELASTLAPDGTVKGNYWIARNPTRTDNNAGSFWIWLKGEKAGGFADSATGDKGDVIDLIAYCNGCPRTPPTREKRVEAIQWAKKFLGLDGQKPDQVKRQAQAASEKKRERDLEAEAERQRKERRAFELYMSATALAGSLADIYLAWRGIDIRAIANMENDLRFLARLRHFEDEHIGPAMVAPFRKPDGAIVGIHATWLRADGKGKADVSKAKMMFGSCKGNSIRLTRGASGLSVKEAVDQYLRETQGLSEGIENGLTVALACPELRIDAAGSLGNLRFYQGYASTARVLLLGDNDPKPQAIEAIELAQRELSLRLPTAIAKSLWAKDFNDELRDK